MEFKTYNYNHVYLTIVGVYNAKSVEQLTIPQSQDRLFLVGKDKDTAINRDVKVEAINADCFRHLTNLKKVNLIGPLVVIDSGAFAYLSKLEEIRFGNHLTVIGAGAFYGTAVKKLEFPPTLQTIYDQAFMDCKNLETINFNKDLVSIGQEAFKNTNVKTLIFNDGLVSIGNYAFVGIDEFDEIYIPYSVKTIGYSAFGNGVPIKRMYYEGDRTSWRKTGVHYEIYDDYILFYSKERPEEDMLDKTWTYYNGERVKWSEINTN